MATPNPFSYVQFGAAKQALLLRLSDAGTFTTADEAGLCIIEGLSVFNALTSTWMVDYILDFANGDQWKSLATPVDSPRVRTTSDTSLYTIMQYALLEPPTGGTWTGTTQFSIADLQQALQRSVDEILQLTGANITQLFQTAPITTVRSQLPDNVLNLSRVRLIPTKQTDGSLDTANAYTLYRADRLSVQSYQDVPGSVTGMPDEYLQTSTSPLYFDLSLVPVIPSELDMLVMESQIAFDPPAATLVNLPNDWCWVARWKALGDLLMKSPEGIDLHRARYCIERYKRGVKAMMSLPWVVAANINGAPSDIPSVAAMDAYCNNWEVRSPVPYPVIAGVDYLALGPFNTTSATVSVNLTLVGNAPLPVDDNSYLQVSRDVLDQILNYSQHIATFKQGGQEFIATMTLYDQFENMCAIQNRRYASLGIARESMLGIVAMDILPRFEGTDAEVGNG